MQLSGRVCLVQPPALEKSTMPISEHLTSSWQLTAMSCGSHKQCLMDHTRSQAGKPQLLAIGQDLYQEVHLDASALSAQEMGSPSYKVQV